MLFSLAADSAEGQQAWDRFRGPNGSGVSLESKLPSDCSNYTWKKELKGSGSSSPVIWGNRLFVTSCNPESASLHLQCLDVGTGEDVWSRDFESRPYHLHSRNSFASATPAVDHDHVYVTYADPEHTRLVALDHDGNPVWSRDFGRWVSQHGFGISPQVYREHVVFFNSQQADRVRSGPAGDSRLIAVNRKDGSDVWTVPLKATRTCYSMPAIMTDADGEAHWISCNTGDGFFCINAKTGEKNWSLLPFRMRTVASTLVANGMVVGSCGSGGGGNYLVAIKLSADPSQLPQKAFQIPNANYVPSPIAVDDKLFFFTDKGVARCVDLQSGKSIWKKRLAPGFSGSPVATEDKIFIADEQGTVHVLAVSEEFKRLAEHDLGESTRATPAIRGDQIFFRTDSHLICVGTEQ
jgi:outer membrane protein assembly factor BamB